MNNTAHRRKITVSADGTGLVSQAGTLLLAETLRVTGLGQGLSGGLARWRAPRAVHDPGKIIADLAMTLALGGDCLANTAVLRAQPELCGPVASDPVVSRLVSTADPAEGGVEFFLAREEGVVLGGDVPGGLGEVQRDVVVGLDHEEMREPGRCRQTKNRGQEGRRPLLVTA